MIASIFPGSTAMPSLLTMYPSKVPLVTLNAHLAGFKLCHAMRHHSLALDGVISPMHGWLRLSPSAAPFLSVSGLFRGSAPGFFSRYEVELVI